MNTVKILTQDLEYKRDNSELKNTKANEKHLIVKKSNVKS